MKAEVEGIQFSDRMVWWMEGWSYGGGGEEEEGSGEGEDEGKEEGRM